MRRIIVISDLHLGGEASPMLGHPEMLCKFLEQITAYGRSSNEQLELVINGDFVDFLAIEPYSAWTEREIDAITKLDKVSKQFANIFDKLAECISRVNYLTILLGNHDIESAYPRVHRALLSRLGTNPHRCVFINNNQAYRCGDLLIEHGNRYDAWNAIDHEDFQKLLSQMSRQETLGNLHVCPGSQMVEKMVNPLKSDYPFIDLLKPETKVLPLVLSALEPSLKRDVKRIYNLFNFWSKQWLRTRSWIPIVQGKKEELIAATNVRTGMPPELKKAFADELSDMDETEQPVSLKQAWSWTVKKIRPDSIATKIKNHEPIDDKQLERIRLSLDHAMKGDRTFDDDGPDGPYTDAARRLILGAAADGPRPRIVVMGHTHQIRKVDLGEGRWYLNTGTWVDLIKVPPNVFAATSDRTNLDQWLRQLLLNPNAIRIADPAYADLLLDADGCLRQPDNRPVLRRFADGAFSTP